MRHTSIKRFAIPAIITLSLFVMFKANPEPDGHAQSVCLLGYLLARFPIYNQVLFELAIGMLVSMATYILVVVLPERARKRRVKQTLELRYADFKQECIINFLFALGEPAADMDLVEKLAGVHAFRDFFRGESRPGISRWDDVYNRIEPEHLEAIAREMALLADEVKYVLSVVNVDNDELFAFFKRFSAGLALRNHVRRDNNELEGLMSFLYEIFASWSNITGYQNADFVAERMAEI